MRRVLPGQEGTGWSRGDCGHQPAPWGARLKLSARLKPTDGQDGHRLLCGQQGAQAPL
jgi:hypothetical protein